MLFQSVFVASAMNADFFLSRGTVSNELLRLSPNSVDRSQISQLLITNISVR